jgi:hypothetical protein
VVQDLNGELFPRVNSESEVEVGADERQPGLMSHDGGEVDYSNAYELVALWRCQFGDVGNVGGGRGSVEGLWEKVGEFKASGRRVIVDFA